ncbi:MAG: hypothetical protein ABIH37_05340 [archaeon]
MSLKQLKDLERIYFLQYFTAELVKNTARDIELRNRIEAEKIKIKFIQPHEETKLDHIGVSFNQEPIEPKKEIEFEKSLHEKKELIAPVHHIKFIKKPKRFQRPRPIVKLKPKPAKTPFPIFSNKEKLPQGTIDTALKKIEPLIQDKSIQLIECPGPGKNVLVKARNKINTTKVALSENEIKNVINYFSDKSMIPIIGGILKAAVDDLIISAIISEFVGSRFIINKKSPYELIERMRR